MAPYASVHLFEREISICEPLVSESSLGNIGAGRPFHPWRRILPAAQRAQGEDEDKSQPPKDNPGRLLHLCGHSGLLGVVPRRLQGLLPAPRGSRPGPLKPMQFAIAWTQS